MPANLPPQYTKAEDDLRRAATPAARLEGLRELFRLLPKHKGTERLQSDLKKRISRARDDLDGAKAGGKSSGVSRKVVRQGAGQVALVGAPNAGKSALLAALTDARPEVAPYPFTTRAPMPGMMLYEDVRLQLVDLPPVTADLTEPWLPGFVRQADAALLVVDLGDDDLIEGAEAAIKRLAAGDALLVGELPADPGDGESTIHVRTAVVAAKGDAEGAADRLAILREALGGRYPIVEASAAAGTGLDAVRRVAYDALDMIRVYTKVPGKALDRSSPYTVPRGSTVADLAGAIHADLARGLKFAKVWGSAAFDGQAVKRDHPLGDGDVVELHA